MEYLDVYNNMEDYLFFYFQNNLDDQGLRYYSWLCHYHFLRYNTTIRESIFSSSYSNKLEHYLS